MALPRQVAWLAVVACALQACDGSGRPEVTHDPGGADAAADAQDLDGAPEASLTDSATPADAEAGAPDAPLLPVHVGIVPMPRSAAAGTGVAEQLDAHLQVIAAGSRATVLHASWKELYSTPVVARTEAWSLLDASLGLYADEPELEVLVSVDVVDRTLDSRPDGLTGSFAAQASLDAIDRLVDRLFASAGAELSYLAFGREIDRWLATHGALQRADMVRFLNHAIDYARQHPARPDGLVVGVLLSSSAVLAPSAEVEQLLAVSDAAMLSHFAIGDDFQARAPSAVSGELDALRAATHGDAGPTLPVVLAEVGYPSSELVAGSEAKQTQFYDNLFQALSFRREAFPFVAAFALNDQAAEVCEAEAAAMGAAGSAEAVEARCSLGLRSGEAVPKPAWGSVLDALATFRAP